MMELVVIESPYAGDVDRNREYLKLAVLDCLKRGESPYASHAFFTQYLDDSKPDERRLGIDAGFEWAKLCKRAVFYLDYGWSSGMKAALEWHMAQGHEIETRTIPEIVSEVFR